MILFNFLTKEKKINNKKEKDRDFNNEIIYNINEINIDDSYIFVLEKYENKKKYILSKLREYKRLLNNNMTINYKKKLLFPRKKKKDDFISKKYLIIVTNCLKMKNDIEN